MKNLRLVVSSIAILLMIFSSKEGKAQTTVKKEVSDFENLQQINGIKDTLYLNLDITDNKRWQLCHLEVVDNFVNPFVILGKVTAKAHEDDKKTITKMNLITEALLGNNNVYRIIKARDSVKGVKRNNKTMVKIYVEVGLNKMENIDNTNEATHVPIRFRAGLDNNIVDKNTVFDYHIIRTKELDRYIEANFKTELSDEQSGPVIKGCCGMICATKMMY